MSVITIDFSNYKFLNCKLFHVLLESIKNKENDWKEPVVRFPCFLFCSHLKKNLILRIVNNIVEFLQKLSLSVNNYNALFPAKNIKSYQRIKYNDFTSKVISLGIYKLTIELIKDVLSFINGVKKGLLHINIFYF